MEALKQELVELYELYQENPDDMLVAKYCEGFLKALTMTVSKKELQSLFDSVNKKVA